MSSPRFKTRLRIGDRKRIRPRLFNFRPLSAKGDYFLKLLAKAIQHTKGPFILAGTKPVPVQAGDPAEKILGESRWLLVLEGRMRYSLSSRGERREVWAEPGTWIYWPPHGWTLEHWEKSCAFLGVVLRSTHVRIILVDYPGGCVQPILPWSHYHTAQPLSSPGNEMIFSLETLSHQAKESEATKTC